MSRQTGEFGCRSNTDTPRKFHPLQAFFGDGFALPEISPFRAGQVPERPGSAAVRLSNPSF
jgi:hypothetical protein